MQAIGLDGSAGIVAEQLLAGRTGSSQYVLTTFTGNLVVSTMSLPLFIGVWLRVCIRV